MGPPFFTFLFGGEKFFFSPFLRASKKTSLFSPPRILAPFFLFLIFGPSLFSNNFYPQYYFRKEQKPGRGKERAPRQEKKTKKNLF